MDTSLFNKMRFVYPWRKYQSMVLQKFASDSKVKESKLHIVAPPGSGKTILGLELIKIIGRPAVIFSPTSTIQLQWKEKIKLFLRENEWPLTKEIASIAPDRISLINSYTYQLISSPSENQQFIEEIAVVNWSEALFRDGIAKSIDDAMLWIETLRKANPNQYSKSITKYYKSAKDNLLSNPDFDTLSVLHPNAKKLIQDLVNAGVKTVILDEAHHMLDYWAVVLRALLKEIGDYKIIGLTATPPIDASKEDLDNYISLLGDIDFEVPTPAVVKEGNLAPYQDLVYFVTPTPQEKLFIKNLQGSFEQVITKITHHESFKNWFLSQPWAQYIKEDVPLAVAGQKFFRINEITLPKGTTFFDESYKDMYIEDWVLLLSHYSLNHLLLSGEPGDQKLFGDIKKVLKDFGFSLTDRGVRSSHSPADKILSLSESKADAAVEILKNEMKYMGDSLRAVIMTDFENESAYTKKYLSGVLNSNSGGALFAYQKIVQDKDTTKLEAILVTGKRVLIDHDEKQLIVGAMKKWRDLQGLNFEIEVNNSIYPHILEIAGSGKDWKSNTYVRMVTSLFEDGITKCIVGTRGLLAEGWDSLALNTVIDLTTATTSTTVQQLRGRSLRLDPNFPQKVANNWDVVCVETNFEKGDQDYRRFERKHSRFYGLGTNKLIVRGVAHVDHDLFYEISLFGFKSLALSLTNARMINKAGKRAQAYREWQIGDPYSNFKLQTTTLDTKDIKFKTAATFSEALKGLLNAILIKVIGSTLLYFYILGQTGLLNVANPKMMLFLITALLFLIYIDAGRSIYKYFLRAFVELPADSYILDMSKAVLTALRKCKLISGEISTDNLRVGYTQDGFIQVYLDYANDKDVSTFSRSFNELFEPLIDQRYIVERSEADLNLGFYKPIWYIIRNLYGAFFDQDKVSYHAVPSILATHRKKAQIFRNEWQHYVGGKRLYYTRSVKGAKVLLNQRSKKHERIKRVTLDLWK